MWILKQRKKAFNRGGYIMKKKKLLVLTLLATFCLLVSFQSVRATEKTVTLTVPGCVWAKTAVRVGSILKGINGVSKVDTDPINHKAIVTFDSEKTSVEKMKKALADGGFPVEGEPQFLK